MKHWIATVLAAAVLFSTLGLTGCATRDPETMESHSSEVSESSTLPEDDTETEETPEDLNTTEDSASSSQPLSPGNPGATEYSGEVILEQPSIEEAAKGNAKIKDKDIHLLQLEEPFEGDPVALLHTSEGVIAIRLFPEQAPLAVENFATLAEEGYFDGMTFNRIMENFYVESGSPKNALPTSIYKNNEGHAIPFVTETSLDLWNFRGALVMKNKGMDRPHTNTSEFRIVQASTIGDDWFEKMEETKFPQKVIDAYKELGGIPGFDSRCTVFGHVISGMSVVDRIATAPTSGNAYTPESPVAIDRIEITTYDSSASYTSETEESYLDAEEDTADALSGQSA